MYRRINNEIYFNITNPEIFFNKWRRNIERIGLTVKNIKSATNCLVGYRTIILAYHSIADNAQDPWSVSRSIFTSQMDWLKRNAYAVLSLRQIVDNILQNRKRRNCVVLTFDDGYADFLQNAAPILKNYDFPATLFVPSNVVGDVSFWEPFEIRKSLLDWNGLREVAKLGYSIGSHGMTHNNLTKLNLKEMTAEVSDSKKKLESELGISVDFFSYPYGKFAEREISAVKKAGYVCGVIVGDRWGNGNEADLFRLERVIVGHKDSLSDFALKVSGQKKVFMKLRNLLLRFNAP